jgi:hypothetical protein
LPDCCLRRRRHPVAVIICQCRIRSQEHRICFRCHNEHRVFGRRRRRERFRRRRLNFAAVAATAPLPLSFRRYTAIFVLTAATYHPLPAQSENGGSEVHHGKVRGGKCGACSLERSFERLEITILDDILFNR